MTTIMLKRHAEEITGGLTPCTRRRPGRVAGQGIMLKRHAEEITGGLTQTSKMPCLSNSLPTLACHTGYKLAQTPGTICSNCYADKGFYALFASTIEPAQMARLAALDDPLWTDGMVRLITGHDYFRWHDSGDLQSVAHLERIVEVCQRTPQTQHWLPTREVGMLTQFVRKHGRNAVPPNLTIRLSATYPDQPVRLPRALEGVPGIATSNVHSPGMPALGSACGAYDQGNKCGDCRACWDATIPAISYPEH